MKKTHSLSPAEQEALSLLKTRIHAPFPGAKLVLYGSRARGNHEADSDIDILALLDGEITSDTHERISRCAYDIELEYDIVISILLESLTFWNSHKASLMPIHQVIEEEGVVL